MELTRDVQRDGLDFAQGKLRDVFEVSDIAGDELSLGKKGGGGDGAVRRQYRRALSVFPLRGPEANLRV